MIVRFFILLLSGVMITGCNDLNKEELEKYLLEEVIHNKTNFEVTHISIDKKYHNGLVKFRAITKRGHMQLFSLPFTTFEDGGLKSINTSNYEEEYNKISDHKSRRPPNRRKRTRLRR